MNEELTKYKRNSWINRMYAYCMQDPNARFEQDGTKVNVYYDNNPYRIERGSSFCHPDDEFDFTTGVAIAYARLIKESIPFYVLKDKFTLKDVKIGQIFCLNRTQERYVKVKETRNGSFCCTNITTGEILIIARNEPVQTPFKW